LLGDRDDESEVRLDEGPLGLLPLAGHLAQLATLRRRQLAALVELLTRRVAVLDLLRETDLVVLGQQRVLADVGEVEPDDSFLAALEALLGHGILSGTGVGARRPLSRDDSPGVDRVLHDPTPARAGVFPQVSGCFPPKIRVVSSGVLHNGGVRVYRSDGPAQT